MFFHLLALSEKKNKTLKKKIQQISFYIPM